MNTTFYHMARQTTFEKWREEVPRDFKYTLKLYRLFIHYKRLVLKKEEIKILKAFIENGLLLKNKLGPILIQLPPSLKCNHAHLDKFLTQMEKIESRLKVRLKHAIEFRHETWFNEQTYQLLKRHKAALVITNSPHWPYSVIKTANFLYMRFHGRTKLFASNYTKAELRVWAKTLKALKAKEVYAYFNNDANAYAADNALYLKQRFD